MGKKFSMKERAVAFFQQGLAELGAYWRHGLKDFQHRVLGEYAGQTPSEPGMAGSMTQQQQTVALEGHKAGRHAEYEQWRDEQAAQPDKAAEVSPPDKRPPEQDRSPEID